MDKSLNNMTDKANTEDKDVRIELVGKNAQGKEITLEINGKESEIPRELFNPGYFMGCNLPPELEALAKRMDNANKLKGDNTPINVVKWGLLSLLMELSPFFCDDSEIPDSESLGELTKFASIFLPWRYENVEEIRAFKDKAKDRDEAESQIKQFFFDYYQEKHKAPSIADFRRYFKRQAGVIPAPKSLGYLVHSSENEAVNKFFAFGWYRNEQPQEYPICATRSGGKYLKKSHVIITPYFKTKPPVLANLVYFHAVEIGRLHRLDSDNKEDPFGPHYFTVESVVRALTGTRKNGADIRSLEIYQEVIDTLNWLKENRHTFDGRHFVDTRCKDQNRQRLYVRDPILNWRIDPEARIDGSLTEVYIFDRIPPMFWMTDELARIRRIKSARFMPEGPSAPRRNGSFLALFDAAFEPICRQAYFIANGMTEDRSVPVYLHDDLAKNRTGVFSAAGMPRPEDCTEKTYKSNREKLTKIFDHLEKIGMLTYKPINEGRKIIGYMLTIKNERLIFGTTEERIEAQKALDKPIPKKS